VAGNCPKSKTKSIVSFKTDHMLGETPLPCILYPLLTIQLTFTVLMPAQKLSSHRHYPIAAGHMDSPARKQWAASWWKFQGRPWKGFWGACLLGGPSQLVSNYPLGNGYISHLGKRKIIFKIPILGYLGSLEGSCLETLIYKPISHEWAIWKGFLDLQSS